MGSFGVAGFLRVDKPSAGGVPMFSVLDLRSLSKDAYKPAICVGLPLALASELASMIMLTSWVWAVPNQSGLLDLIAATCSLVQLLMFLRSHSSANRARWVSSLVRRPIPLKWATRQPAGLSSWAKAVAYSNARDRPKMGATFMEGRLSKDGPRVLVSLP